MKELTKDQEFVVSMIREQVDKTLESSSFKKEKSAIQFVLSEKNDEFIQFLVENFDYKFFKINKTEDKENSLDIYYYGDGSEHIQRNIFSKTPVSEEIRLKNSLKNRLFSVIENKTKILYNRINEHIKEKDYPKKDVYNEFVSENEFKTDYIHRLKEKYIYECSSLVIFCWECGVISKDEKFYLLDYIRELGEGFFYRKTNVFSFMRSIFPNVSIYSKDGDVISTKSYTPEEFEETFGKSKLTNPVITPIVPEEDWKWNE